MRIIVVVFAIASGLLVLLGYFIPVGILQEIRQLFLQWAVILAGVAVVVGVFNLFDVHWSKIHEKQKGRYYSILLIVSLGISAALGLVFGPDSDSMRFFLDAIIVPAEATLMALLAVTLIYASVRLFRRRTDLMTGLFLGVVVVTLLASVPLPFGKIPVLSDILHPLLVKVFAVGGARGILLGVSLGALVTGLRVLFGVDRPYGGR